MNKYHDEEMEKAITKTREICNGLPEYVTKFIRSIQQRTEPKTRLEYSKDLRNFFEYIVDYAADHNIEMQTNTVPIEYIGDLNREYFEEYLDYLQQYKKGDKIYKNSRNTIKRKLSTLRKFYNFLFINDYIKVNNILKVEIPKLKEKEIIFMDRDEAKEFINGVENGINNESVMAKAYHDKQELRDLAIVSLLLSTGIRVSECVGLDIEDVDFKNNCIKVIRKGGKEGIVYFSDNTAEILERYIMHRNNQVAKEEATTALFLSSRMTRLGVRSIEKLVKKYAQATVPMKKITPHKLRSTYGTALYEETNDIYVVADVLGHNNINTTSKHYSNMSDKRKKEVRNEVDYTND